jgi:membrane protease YdiL (CAAX protease family)
MLTHARPLEHPRLRLELIAWSAMLAVSLLPDALLHELTGASPGWLRWAKMLMLAGLAMLAFVASPFRPLRRFFIILLAIFAFEEIAVRLGGSALWRAWFDERLPFVSAMLGTQLLRLAVALAMIGLLLVLGYRRRQFFLQLGRPSAPIEPAPWLGYNRPISWVRFGLQWSLIIALGLLAFLLLGGRPSVPALLRTLPLLPMVLVLAAMNAFSEEITYRASLIAGLEAELGPHHAVWNAALFFGLGHYFGVPFGLVGALMATFLGWMLGKAMVETRGSFWAWFIHFVQDVLIFTFMAAGSVAPGGT